MEEKISALVRGDADSMTVFESLMEKHGLLVLLANETIRASGDDKQARSHTVYGTTLSLINALSEYFDLNKEAAIEITVGPETELITNPDHLKKVLGNLQKENTPLVKLTKKEPNHVVQALAISVEQFFDALKVESQRGKVILLATQIDEMLAKMALAFLREPRSGEKLFSGGMNPLSSFSSHIEICYRLGLISKDAADCYDILRNIRNRCAHDLKPYSFKSAEHKQQFGAFKELSYKISGISLLMELIEKLSEKDDDVFAMLCVVHFILLEGNLKSISKTDDKFFGPATPEQQRDFFKKQGLI